MIVITIIFNIINIKQAYFCIKYVTGSSSISQLLRNNSKIFTEHYQILLETYRAKLSNQSLDPFIDTAAAQLDAEARK